MSIITSLNDLRSDEYLSNFVSVIDDPLVIYKRINKILSKIHATKGMLLGEVTLKEKHCVDEDPLCIPYPDYEDNTPTQNNYSLTHLYSRLEFSDIYCIGGCEEIDKDKKKVLEFYYDQTRKYRIDALAAAELIKFLELEYRNSDEEGQPLYFFNFIECDNPDADSLCYFDLEEPMFLVNILKSIGQYLTNNVEFSNRQILRIFTPGDSIVSKSHGTYQNFQIGTLIVCLPSKYTGGKLHVRSGDHETVYNFSEKSENTSLIQWVAFFDDCEYEIKPITEGYLVILTFEIMWKVASKYGAPNTVTGGNIDSIGKDTNRTQTLIQKIVDNMVMRNEDVGFILRERYSFSQLSRDGLRDIDKILFSALNQSNKFDLEIHPSVFRHRKVIPDECCDDRTHKQLLTLDVYKFSQLDIEQQESKKRKRFEYSYREIPFIMSHTLSRDSEPKWDILSRKKCQPFVTSSHDYVEGEKTKFYIVATLVVHPKKVSEQVDNQPPIKRLKVEQ
jgi:hypothetical protein